MCDPTVLSLGSVAGGAHWLRGPSARGGRWLGPLRRGKVLGSWRRGITWAPQGWLRWHPCPLPPRPADGDVATDGRFPDPVPAPWPMTVLPCRCTKGGGGEVGGDPLCGVPSAWRGGWRGSSFGNPQASAGSRHPRPGGTGGQLHPPPLPAPPPLPSPSLFVPHLMYSSGRLAENKGGSLGNRGLL